MCHDLVDMSLVSHPSAFNAYKKFIQNDVMDINLSTNVHYLHFFIKKRKCKFSLRSFLLPLYFDT